jgi:hypothetical protein
MVPAGTPPATQVVSLGGGQGAELVLPDRTVLPLHPLTTIGRDPSLCNLTFPDDERVSRTHARIEEQSGIWMLTDLNSSNGTYLNSVRISLPTPLKTSDQIGIGQSVYVFRLIGVPQVASPQAGPLTPYAGQQGLMPPQPGLQGGLQQPWGAPGIQQAPPGGWRNWKTLPGAEGYVRFISERYKMKKDDLLKRGIAAAALGLLISPALVFLPFMQGTEINVRDLRIEDHLSGRQIDVLMRGDVMGSINLSDAIAIWGPVQGGVLLMEAAYNYNTDTSIQVKK